MARGHTGFDGDDYPRGGKLGIYMGRVVDRDDPDQRGRVRVRIPGMIEEKSAWAVPRGGGYTRWGIVAVPPLDADVLVQFINGDQGRPVYEPADYGVRGDEDEVFPEHNDPDVVVMGYGPFRLVFDLRDTGDVSPSLTIKQVAVKADGTETDTAWLRLTENSIQAHGESVAQVSSGALTDVRSEGGVQVGERKVMPGTRPIK